MKKEEALSEQDMLGKLEKSRNHAMQGMYKEATEVSRNIRKKIDSEVMHSELYEQSLQNEDVDYVIYEAEVEMEDGAKTISLDNAMEILNKKYYG